MAAIELSVAWYVYRAGHRHGPMSGLELALLAKSNVLRHNDLIWCEGLPDWVEAGAVGGLLQDNKEPPRGLSSLTQAYLDARVKAVNESRARVRTLNAGQSERAPESASSFVSKFAREGLQSRATAEKQSRVAVNLPAASGRIAPLLPLEFAAAPAM
jgi:hypothetical protein